MLIYPIPCISRWNNRNPLILEPLPVTVTFWTFELLNLSPVRPAVLSASRKLQENTNETDKTTTCTRMYVYEHPVTVTTRIITFLVGNPYKPLFATVTGMGPHVTAPIYPMYTVSGWNNPLILTIDPNFLGHGSSVFCWVGFQGWKLSGGEYSSLVVKVEYMSRIFVSHHHNNNNKIWKSFQPTCSWVHGPFSTWSLSLNIIVRIQLVFNLYHISHGQRVGFLDEFLTEVRRSSGSSSSLAYSGSNH